MTEQLILIDASSYFYRAFHALPPLKNSKGQPTGAIYGVANMVKKLLKDFDSKRVVAVFDAKGKTFRDDLYPEYKAHRPPTPPELSVQFEPLIGLLEAMGVPLLIVPHVEADDVIGTLATNASRQGQKVLISTSDKDLAQLVNEHITLMNTMTNTFLDTDAVKEKFGVFPSQIIDYLTLVGDTVDNVPGVPKCGPKTAAKWLGDYQTLDNLITHANDIGGKVGEYLRTSIPHLPLSKRLVTIKCDVDLPLSLDELVLKPADNQLLIERVQDMEFKTWLKELLSKDTSRASNDNPSTQSAIDYELITSIEVLNEWIALLQGSSLFCIDTETTSLDTMLAEVVGISLAIEGRKPAYIPLMHKDNSVQLAKHDVLSRLKPILENPNKHKVGQNIKYDYGVLHNEGIEMQGMAYDTMLESYVLDSTERHDMDSLALKYLHHKTISYEEVAGKGAKQLRFDEVAVSVAAPYAAEDAQITLALHQTLYPKLDEQLQPVLQEIEMPLLLVLAQMERTGVLIDADVLKKHGQRLKERIAELEAEAERLVGRSFNLNSPKQLQEILFEEQKLPVVSKTPTGQPSTSESVLQELAYDYRLPSVILEYRSLAKLVSTYIDSLPQKINPKTNRVHTSYNQAVAATGRLSSSEPNLQNIPIRSEEGRLIRKAFIAPKGSVLLAADYSQIELRIMAHLSGDEGLLRAFSLGQDIHSATASEIFQTPLEQVSSEQRRKAKAVNFGLIYGMSSFGLAKQLGVERSEAQHYIDTYFARYPNVLAYMDKIRHLAHAQGYVETLFGRRLYLSEINTKNMMRQKAAERMAINAPMQGTAADIIKKTMIAIAAWQKTTEGQAARMIMQVHDELVFEVQEEALNECMLQIRHIMENTVKLSVPMVVSIGTGMNWDAAH